MAKKKFQAQFNYDFIDEFKEGKAVVRLNGKYGYIDENGKEIIPPIYEQATPFQNGVATVKFKNWWRNIDSTGKTLASQQEVEVKKEIEPQQKKETVQQKEITPQPLIVPEKKIEPFMMKERKLYNVIGEDWSRTVLTDSLKDLAWGLSAKGETLEEINDSLKDEGVTVSEREPGSKMHGLWIL